MWNFNATDFPCIFIIIVAMLRKFLKISKSSSLKETGPSYCQMFVCSDNSRQNIWHRVEKCSKTGQDYKNLISHFACFLTAFVKA